MYFTHRTPFTQIQPGVDIGIQSQKDFNSQNVVSILRLYK